MLRYVFLGVPDYKMSRARTPPAKDAAQERHAVALATLLKDSSQDSVIAGGGVAALVALLAPGWTEAVHEQAAAALRNLCCGNAQNCDSVRACGGIAALVALLAPGSSAAVHEQAAAVLQTLCLDNAQHRDSVRECGGIAALVALLAPGGSAAVHEQAAKTLLNLCLNNAQNCNSMREGGGHCGARWATGARRLCRCAGSGCWGAAQPVL